MRFDFSLDYNRMNISTSSAIIKPLTANAKPLHTQRTRMMQALAGIVAIVAIVTLGSTPALAGTLKTVKKPASSTKPVSLMQP
jgi:hypothetical protein